MFGDGCDSFATGFDASGLIGSGPTLSLVIFGATAIIHAAPATQRENEMRLMAALTFWVALCPVVTLAATPETCSAPAAMADGWPVTSAAQQGLDPQLICAIGPRLQELTAAAPNGVVIVRHGALVYEAYFTGADQRWPEHRWGEPLPVLPHDAETKHDLSSITKSVVALLVGVALDRGAIKTVDAPALDLFPDYADLHAPDRDRITLRDLLTMRAGLRWVYKPYLSMARQMEAAPDPYRFVLEQPVTAAPEAVYRYNNGVAELVGAIVQKAAQRRLDQFAKESLFDPLGVADWEWGRMPGGDPGASWGLRLRPRDLAKIGQLVLDHGAWRGKQIVSDAWIKEMTAPQVVRHDGSVGYFWWLNQVTIDGRDVDLVAGYGWGGQLLCVVPSLDMVIVVTAGVYDYDGDGDQGRAGDAARDMALRAALGN
jgi:CubicO group peptidase (beta-lactamase class C family)